MLKVQKFFAYLLIIPALSVATSSCADKDFKIKGEITGAPQKSVVLEKSDFQGRWMPIDSVTTNKNGGFKFSFPSPTAPDIYRLAFNNQYIYIPVDSTETVSVFTSAQNFGHDFSLEGSRNAVMLEKFEKELQKANVNNQDSIVAFKRNVYSNYMKDAPGSILSFYILTKTIDGKPLYNPADPADRKYFGAVATGYKTVRPDDPHAALLEQTAIQAIRQKNVEAGNFRTLEADEITLIDMDLQDETGKYVKLSDIVGKGKPVVVIFSLLNHSDSPELNINLAEIYNRHKGNVEFYHVSLDADQYAWREAARNLPWITVYSPGQNTSQDAIKYNVDRIPSFYIYNSDGELTERPLTLRELNTSLK